jgi:hypothetical protein
LLIVRAAILCVAFAVAGGAIAASEPPSPSPIKRIKQPQAQPHESQYAAADDKRGTASAPLVIDVLPAKDAEEAAKRERENEKEKSHNDSLIAHGTVALAFITTVLAAFTWKLWRSTSDLVERSERSTHASERAYIKLSPKPPGLQFGTNGNATIATEIKNFGRTPGSVTYCSLWLRMKLRADDFPANPAYGDTPDANIPRVFLVTNDSVGVVNTLHIGEDSIKALHDGNADLLAVGYVDYMDQFGGRYRGGFARIFSPAVDGNNLIVFTRRGYNYDRPREQGEGIDWDESPPT